MPFVPTMMFYFGLGALAAYKAIWEMVRAPFYWDKTQHGVTASTDPLPQTDALDTTMIGINRSSTSS